MVFGVGLGLGGVTSHSRSPDGGECGIRVTQMEEMGWEIWCLHEGILIS